MPCPARVPVLWAGRGGETARRFYTGPRVSIPDPCSRAWRKGQPLTGDPRATLLKPQGCRTEAIGEEVPNTDQSALQVLKKQRLSMV